MVTVVVGADERDGEGERERADGEREKREAGEREGNEGLGLD